MKSLFVIGFAVLVSIPSVANINVSPSYIYFGQVKVGTSYNQRMVYIQNNGDQPVSIQVSGFCSPNYRVNNGCYVLNKYGSCTINVNFTPTRPGSHVCSLSVRGSDGSYTPVNIQGIGVK